MPSRAQRTRQCSCEHHVHLLKYTIYALLHATDGSAGSTKSRSTCSVSGSMASILRSRYFSTYPVVHWFLPPHFHGVIHTPRNVYPFLSATPQPNGWKDTWAEFWVERRLKHMIKLSERDGAVFSDKEEVINKASCGTAYPDLGSLSTTHSLTLFFDCLWGRPFSTMNTSSWS